MNVKLTKVFREADIPGGLRTPVIVGVCETFPVIGSPFTMTAEPLDGGTVRYVQTSNIKELDILDNIITITTQSNSIYTIEVLED